jgi:bacterioferritin-associated ferredoxin
MIICSCNVLTDHDVRAAVCDANEVRRSPVEIYNRLGCSPECGRCARSIRTIIFDALGDCARACSDGCQHQQAHACVVTTDAELLGA